MKKRGEEETSKNGQESAKSLPLPSTVAAGGRIHPSQWSHPIAVRRERKDGVVVSVIIISQFIKGNLRHVIVVSIRDRINSRLALAEEAHQVSSSRREKSAITRVLAALHSFV